MPFSRPLAAAALRLACRPRPASLLPRRAATLPPPVARRGFAGSAPQLHGHVSKPPAGEELHVTFIDKDATSTTLTVAAGDNLLDIAQAHDLEMEGACGGSAACSTCHVIVEGDAMYDAMPEPDDDENDMLDLAFGLTETSRLGCQVKMSKELDGLVVRLPNMTRNLQSSDFGSK
ncbi:2Fe-2S ferredoxin-type domain-containing protein [Geopyxis carbonaria]|nr:2Fe-2S ferredoxin-type domain-containing protein [Geopyxis carbonaria]